jgi:hypothetical protein
MALTPLELGSQPLKAQTQKKTPTDKEPSSSSGRRCPVDDLWFCLVNDHHRQKWAESISNGSEIKAFDFIDAINRVYERGKAAASNTGHIQQRCSVMFLDNSEISLLRFSPLPGLMRRSMS